MKAWVNLNGRLRIQELPVLKSLGHNDVRIRVMATSINPIDLMLREGYGDSLFKWLRQGDYVVPGLDGSGVIEQCGPGVKRFKPGDRVMAAVMPYQSGFCASEIVIHQDHVMAVPSWMSTDQAAAVPYAGLTALSALRSAHLNQASAKSKSVLVHGGTGGVGHILVQLLSHWGAEVYTTCSGQSADWVRSLGAAHVIDYRQEDFTSRCKNLDAVINTIAPTDNNLNEARHLNTLKQNGQYVSLISPTLTLADTLSAPLGLAASGTWMLGAHLYWKALGKNHHWAYFRNKAHDCESLTTLLERNAFRPFINETFDFDNLEAAYALIQNGPARGKLVLHVGQELNAS